MFSLRARLFVVWLLSLAAACAVGWLLFQLYRQSTSAQLARAEAAAARGCERIADRYAFYVTGWAGPVQASADPALRRDLTTVVDLALADSRGVEGGVWQLATGPLAYAFPTYEGSGPKTDLPEAERPRIAALNTAAAQAERSQSAEYAARSQTLVLHACPLPGPIADLTAWTMTRVIAAAGLDALRLGLGVLLGLVLALAALLTWLVGSPGRAVSGGIEAALAQHEPAGAAPPAPPPASGSWTASSTRSTLAGRAAGSGAARSDGACGAGGAGRAAGGVGTGGGRRGARVPQPARDDAAEGGERAGRRRRAPPRRAGRDPGADRPPRPAARRTACDDAAPRAGAGRASSLPLARCLRRRPSHRRRGRARRLARRHRLRRRRTSCGGCSTTSCTTRVRHTPAGGVVTLRAECDGCHAAHRGVRHRPRACRCSCARACSSPSSPAAPTAPASAWPSRGNWPRRMAAGSRWLIPEVTRPAMAPISCSNCPCPPS